MGYRNCKDRKLGASDCWLIPKKMDDKVLGQTLLTYETVIIPGNSSQGYLFIDKSQKQQQQIKDVYRFGVSYSTSQPSSCGSASFGKPLNKCCRSSQRSVEIDLSLKGLWRSPLHVLRNMEEVEKDLKPFLTDKPTAFLFDTRLPETNQKNVYKGYLGIRSAAFGNIAMDIWEVPGAIGSSEFIVCAAAHYSLDVLAQKALRRRYFDFQLLVSELVYSQKVRDVIGGFDF
jgi:hypothetical protein